MNNNYYSALLQDVQVQQTNSNIIKWAQQHFKNLSSENKLKLALEYFNDALKYRLPRINGSQSQNRTYNSFLQIGYKFQTSHDWRQFLLLLSYAFMFIILLSHKKPTRPQMYFQLFALTLMWIDLLIQFLSRCCADIKFSFVSARFYAKLFVIILLSVDQLIAAIGDENVLRPFLFTRACLPFFFCASIRKYFQAIASLYKDILVYIIFYVIILSFFGIIANQIIQLPQDAKYDEFTENYGDVGKSIFLFYVLSTYDSFPDNQLLSIKNNPSIYILFALFIFLNLIIFSNIPTTFLFKSFRQYYSRTILVDQIKQQHSLILSFIALSENGQMKISQLKFLRFLFALYKNKIRYVGYITQICIKMNNTKCKYIELFQFIQLCKIIQSNCAMLPPNFDDIQLWQNFKQKVNQIFGLKQKVRLKKFIVLNALIVLLSIINSLFIFYNGSQIFHIFNHIFTVIFCIQIGIRIIGTGFRGYFRQTLNKVDFFFIACMVFSQFVSSQNLPHNFTAALKLFRFYKVPMLGKHLAERKSYFSKNQFYLKSVRLLNQLFITFPIVMSFFPIFIIISYVLGALGLTIFRRQTNIQLQESPYSRYAQISNFQTFGNSQFLMIQILIEAGWSLIAFDHAYRYGSIIFCILFFVFCHLSMVFLLSSIIKGVIWEIYETVHQQNNKKLLQIIKKQSFRVKLNDKLQQLEKLSTKIEIQKGFAPTTTTSRLVMQKKLDKLILQFMANQNIKNSKFKVSLNIGECYCKHPLSFEMNYVIDEIDEKQRNQNEEDHISLFKKLKNEFLIQNIEDLQKQDIQNYLSILSNKININIGDYPTYVWCPQQLKSYLQSKIIIVHSQNAFFSKDQTHNILNNDQIVMTIKSQLNTLMQIRNTKNRKFLNNLAQIAKQNNLDIEVQKAFGNYQDKTNLSIDNNWILRKAFLANTSQKLIKKFQFQYFSNVYPQNFGHTVLSVCLEPVLRHESKLTYCLRNLLRYKQIKSKQFFSQLSSIESKISSCLLKKGSIFKFIYQINNDSQNWFTIESNISQQINIHFLKNGVWIYYPFIQQMNVYSGKDIFNSQDYIKKCGQGFCKKLLKMVFQSFQTIALGMKDYQDFFEFDPTKRIYNLFFITKNVKSNQQINSNFGIKKIMAVILQNQNQRENTLQYQLSNMVIEDTKKQQTFIFDESQQQTIDKLKKLQFVDDQLTDKQKGLPFQFIVNFMVQIRDILINHSQNLVLQAERAFVQKTSKVQYSQI